MKKFLGSLPLILMACAISMARAPLAGGGGGGGNRPPIPSGKILALYQDCGYRGESYIASAAVIGNSIDRMYVARTSGYALKQTSSINVRPGAYKVEIINTTGSRREILNFHEDCFPAGFNNEVAGVEISPSVIFYCDAGYNGRQYCYTSGGTLEAVPGADFNDCISSIRIPKGYKVTLYEHAGGKGRSITLSTDVPDLGALKFNDLTSSFYVQNPHITRID